MVGQGFGQHVTRFEAIASVKRRGQLRGDGFERPELAIEEFADSASEERFGVSREAAQAGRDTLGVEPVDELTGLGALA